MDDLLLVALAGFLASLVDGALGMGFGPTSSSLLLAAGISPATASTTVNVAKVATGLASGAAHWKLNNVDRRLLVSLALPGAIGAAIGAFVLTSVDGDQLRPVLAVLLAAVGLKILIRFSRVLPPPARDDAPGADATATAARSTATRAVATTGGITNGLIGAWGPVVTPYLLQRGVPPRVVVGTVNTAEIAVALVAAGSLVGAMGRDGIQAAILVSMLVGGAVAAPLAANVVRFIPPRALGLAVATLLLVTQTMALTGAAGLGAARWLAYGVVFAAVAAAALRPRFAARPSEPVVSAAPAVSETTRPGGR